MFWVTLDCACVPNDVDSQCFLIVLALSNPSHLPLLRDASKLELEVERGKTDSLEHFSFQRTKIKPPSWLDRSFIWLYWCHHYSLPSRAKWFPGLRRKLEVWWHSFSLPGEKQLRTAMRAQLSEMGSWRRHKIIQQTQWLEGYQGTHPIRFWYIKLLLSRGKKNQSSLSSYFNLPTFSAM